MNFWKKAGLGILMMGFIASTAHASERYFTYTYEPETMPAKAVEYEQHVTLRAIRNDQVSQDHYTRWDIREELEYGVTDNYSVSLYLNQKSEYFRDPATNAKTNESEFEGVSFENRWMVLNPAENWAGVTLYLEPSIGNGEFELEEKIILGQRFGKEREWKWAFNVSHATEWKDASEPDEEDETEGELEFNFGVTRELNKNWNLGLELRNHNEMPEYETWEHTAFFAGPVVTYRQEKWWMTLTAMGQVYGKNYQDVDPDGESGFVLDEHEYLNVRCIIGVSF